MAIDVGRDEKEKNLCSTRNFYLCNEQQRTTSQKRSFTRFSLSCIMYIIPNFYLVLHPFLRNSRANSLKCTYAYTFRLPFRGKIQSISCCSAFEFLRVAESERVFRPDLMTQRVQVERGKRGFTHVSVFFFSFFATTFCG